MRIYVGNVSYNTTKEALTQAFAAFGEVTNVHLPLDRETGRPRGFAFVEMPDDEKARAAIQGLSGTELDGRKITVNEAKPRPESNAPPWAETTGRFTLESGGGRGGRGKRGGQRREQPRGDNRSRRPLR